MSIKYSSGRLPIKTFGHFFYSRTNRQLVFRSVMYGFSVRNTWICFLISTSSIFFYTFTVIPIQLLGHPYVASTSLNHTADPPSFPFYFGLSQSSPIFTWRATPFFPSSFSLSQRSLLSHLGSTFLPFLFLPLPASSACFTLRATPSFLSSLASHNVLHFLCKCTLYWLGRSSNLISPPCSLLTLFL